MINKDVAIKLVDNLIKGKGTDEQEEEWYEELEGAVPYYNEIYNIIATAKEELSAKEIVEQAEKLYEPIIL